MAAAFAEEPELGGWAGIAGNETEYMDNSGLGLNSDGRKPPPSARGFPSHDPTLMPSPVG